MAAPLKLKPNLLLTFLFFLILCGCTYARFITDRPDLVSDGVEASKVPQFLRLVAAEETCEQSYGFLPCTTSALGNLFLILVYGYLMFLAATYLSAGSELLLEILGPGLVGGLFLPMLGALPDAMLILVSGLSGSTEVAQSQVSVGMGLLAGSTVMLLTLAWGTCVIVGKCDIENSVAIDSKDTKGFSLTGSGISTDVWTSYAGIIMAISVIPFVVVQLPQVLNINSGRHLVVLIALIVSVLVLISYCLYQVFQPKIQKRRLAYVKHKHVMAGLLKHWNTSALGELSTEDGKPNEEALKKIFKTIDDNDDGHLSHKELKALIVGIHFNEISVDENEVVEKVMKDFDISNDSEVNFDEFYAGVDRWLKEARGNDSIDGYHMQTKRDHDLLGIGEHRDETVEAVEDPRWNSIKAALLLLLGTVIAAGFADPLVDTVNNFSAATSIPTFFISFIALPLATNSSEAVSAIIFASRKKIRSASLTFSELYGAVTMNNALCLSVFLALVYARGLVWDFSSEVLVILFVCIVMGVFASTRTTFPLWTALVAFVLYPFSLALVYVLDFVFGWS
ncbi:sodium/calcium exchanger family protein / calcium-binding EF hand family protein [Perilla frutescens var. hirtella]|uniref:Sodium/calcium exchanger family protein / calcium-binding EF hand family protein n=1 Tax=Perilla frutescens var. hirtella TaxID=608512 RepID=A0AAD4JM19_PERFH|nr:sodium/calcium exchanger family protein / calcium-binding EF hand family protein [Perilla frutescens var. hirtella]